MKHLFRLALKYVTRQKLRTALSNCEKSIEANELASAEVDEDMARPENAVNSAKLNELMQKKKRLFASSFTKC